MPAPPFARAGFPATVSTMKVNPLIRLAAKLGRFKAHRALAQFRRGLDDAVALQERVLRAHLAASARSRYGIDFGLPQVADYADFAARLPIVTYDDLAPYIEQVKAGDVSAMFNPATRVHMFAMTSGTTGSAKFIPVTERTLADYRRGWNAWGVQIYDDYPALWLRSLFNMPSRWDEQRTTAGIPCGAVTGFIHRSQQKIVKKFYACPEPVAHISDPEAKYYAAMRFAVARDVAWLAMPNPSTSLRLARSAEQHAETLIRDIADGTLSDAFDVPAEVRRDLAPHLNSDPARAAELETHASSRGRLLPMDYWNLGLLANWTGGTVGLYVRQLGEYYGEVPVRDLGLIASEGRLTVPLESNNPAGVLEVHGNFYEFIPADQIDSPAPDVLRCHELEEGGQYFILLTTSGGLFRYNIGDLVRCDGYVGRAPLLAFLSKGKHASSITGEKLTEHQVVSAAGRAADRLGRNLGDFVLCPRWDDPPYYALRVEAGCCRGIDRDRLGELLDAELGEANVEYASKRHSGRLGAIRVEPVADSYFARLTEQRICDRGGRREQYKHQFLYTEVDTDTDFPRPAGDTPAVEHRR